MKKIFLTIFVLASVSNLFAVAFHLEMIELFSKPMIMISLGGFYFASVEERSLSTLLAIFFSLLGDVFLLSDEYFIHGLFSFLLAHISLIITYRQHRTEEFSDHSLQGIHRIRLAFPVILAGTGLVIILFPVLGDLKIPVIVYAIAITTMVLTALFRFGKTDSKSFWMVFLGAALFFISDSIIAINKFLSPIVQAHLWIMTTYIAAQFFIVSGLIRHSELNQK
jgi:uncharacterized membrane protein YhhN